MLRRLSPCLAALLVAAPAAAQIVTCPAITGSPTRFKLVLDDFSLSGGAAPDLNLFMEGLRNSLQLNIERLRADTKIAVVEKPIAAADKPIAVDVVRCEKRRPRDRNDFDKKQVGLLNSHRVVIEMWAVGSVTPGAKTPEYRAYVNYALIPVRHLVAGQVDDVVTVELRGRAGEPLDALLARLDQSAELTAYAAASLGTKLLQEEDYDRARMYLCKADTALQQPRTPAPPAALAAWVRDLSTKVVEQALKNTGYKGSLRLREGQPPPPCGK